MCAAAVCRNSNGEVLCIRTQKTRGRDPIEGEALAARLAFALAADFQDIDIVIGGDALLLVEQVENLNIQADWIIDAEVSTMRALLQNHANWSIHWSPRDGNYLAHNIAQWAWNIVNHGQISVDMIPQDIVNCDAPAVVGREL